MLSKSLAFGFATTVTTLAPATSGTLLNVAIAAAIALTAGTGQTAQAAVFFDQGLVSNPVSTRTATFGTQTNADNFVPTLTGDISTITFWAEFSNPSNASNPNNFTVQFFNPSGNAPATSPFASFSNVASTNTLTSFAPTVSGVYEFVLNLPSAVAVNAGQTYYLSLTHQTLTDRTFGWSLRSGGGTRWFRSGTDATASSTSAWSATTSASGEFAFRLEGTPIPTPALLPGLVGMSLAALRKRKAELAQEVEEG